MSQEAVNRRLVLTGMLAVMFAGPGLAQHTDAGGADHASGAGRGAGAGGAGGGQHGRPEDAHSGEDDHGDDHTDSHDDDHTDDHDSDHASGGKGKGPYYRGGREAIPVGVSHGRSLEDRVLRSLPF